MKLEYLWRGLPGHPMHPPLTDATIGGYTAAAVLAGLDWSGAADVANAWWIVMVLSLSFGALTALTGVLDWLTITWGTPLWRTATIHGLTNVVATSFFALATILGHGDDEVGGLLFVLVLIGYGALAVGGWIGGTIVFVHGMRVVGEPDLPAGQAMAPTPEGKEEG